MERKTPLRVFVGAITKKWWWLMGSGIGGGQAILASIGVNPIGSWIIGVIVFFVCLIIAGYLAYRDLYISLDLKVEKSTRLQRRKLTWREHIRIDQLNHQMEIIHGHGDHDNIESDAIEGHDWDNILKRNCGHCGKPRNEKGGSYL